VKITDKSQLNAKDRRLRELALYIAEKSSGDESFGATKLNKLLFYSDFLAYLNFDEPITGVDYFRLPKGPAPKRWIPIRDSMVSDGDAKFMPAEFYGFPQQRMVALRPAKLGEFRPEQIALVDKVINIHRGKTAAEISDESHGFVGWKLACDRETIPYQVARVSRRPLSDAELQHGRNLDALASSVLTGKAC
jgi:hypothetical protein